LADIFDDLRLLVSIYSGSIKLAKSLLASVVIVGKQLVLVIVLERDQGLLDPRKP